MAGYGLPVLYTLFAWWLTTGLILYLDGLPPRTYRWSLSGATAGMAASFYGLAASGADTSVGGAYIAFSCGLLAWGWQEMSFLMGFVTGPWKKPCPAGSTGWRRFGYAVQAILYHELAILAMAAAVVLVTWSKPNQVGTWTFMILWGMRLSAKLNVFLGARNLNENWLPEALRHLESFFARKPMNLLFPVSVSFATVITTQLADKALDSGVDDFTVTGYTLLATLMALAILEHWFLMLPLPFAALWNWVLRWRVVQATQWRALRG